MSRRRARGLASRDRGNGRRDSGQAQGRASAHAEHAKHATRDRVVRVAGTQRGRDARQAGALQARRGEETHGAWNGARDVGFASARTVEEDV